MSELFEDRDEAGRIHGLMPALLGDLAAGRAKSAFEALEASARPEDGTAGAAKAAPGGIPPHAHRIAAVIFREAAVAGTDAALGLLGVWEADLARIPGLAEAARLGLALGFLAAFCRDSYGALRTPGLAGAEGFIMDARRLHDDLAGLLASKERLDWRLARVLVLRESGRDAEAAAETSRLIRMAGGLVEEARKLAVRFPGGGLSEYDGRGAGLAGKLVGSGT